MIDVSYLTALAAGALALLSPCSALLLPAFFAYAFQRPERLLLRTVAFYVGLATIMVPLGVGASLASRLFYGHRDLLITGAGGLLIALGAMQVLGRGFAIAPMRRLQARVGGDSAGSVLALGAVYGFAGFCSGPILGAILTVAAASGGAAHGGTLLAVYSLGMAAPLFLLALLWDRFGFGRRRWLRGGTLTLGRLHLHTTSLLSGLLFVGLGIFFLRTQGTAGLPLPASTVDWEFQAQVWLQGATRTITDGRAAAGLAGVAIAAAVIHLRRRRRASGVARTGCPQGPSRRGRFRYRSPVVRPPLSETASPSCAAARSVRS